MRRRWIFPPDKDAAKVRAVVGDHGVPELVAELLLRKGLDAGDGVARFLQPRLRNLIDPDLLDEMPGVVSRLDVALRRNEKIALYGDYDVDGVSSLAILQRVLSAYGGRVESFLPLRDGEGYGLSEAGVERCLELHSPSLLVAVDCGTNSVNEVAAIRARGVDVIIIDHHEFEGVRPDCSALVNPKRGDGRFAYLCSAGLAFKTAHALAKRVPPPDLDLKDLLDLVALATLCDLVPLEEENRILVRSGLRQMGQTRWPGVAALMDVAGVRPPVRSADAGFRLGPRINAAGRLGTAQTALGLFLTNDAATAARLASELDVQNRERQAVERTVVDEVESWVLSNFDPRRDASIVAGNRDWHPGVLGIVASRITRRHHRPALIIGFNESGDGRGSGRSIEGLSLVEALSKCAEFLGAFGGHEMAAGLNVHEECFEEFRGAFEAATRSLVSDEMLVPELRLDAEIDVGEIDYELLEALEQIEPFGMGNSQPVLVVRDVEPCSEPRLLKEKHFRIEFPADRRSHMAIYFNGAERGLPDPPWDVAFHLERNEWNGRVFPQMQIVDIRAAG